MSEETWFKYDSFAWRDQPCIVPVVVEKHTDQSVWVGGRRLSRRTQYDNFFPTLEEAREFVVNKYERRVKALKDELLRNEARLAEVRAREALK